MHLDGKARPVGSPDTGNLDLGHSGAARHWISSLLLGQEQFLLDSGPPGLIKENGKV